MSVGLLYGALGDFDRAFARLEQAYAEHDFGLANNIRWQPYFDPLRADPRFNDLKRAHRH